MNTFGTNRIRGFLKASLSLRRECTLRVGQPKANLDIDYWGDDLVDDDWQRLIQQVAGQMGI